MKKIFLILALVLLSLIITLSGGWSAFLNVPSLLMVILLPLSAILICCSPGELGRSFKVAFHPEEYDEPAGRKAVVIQKALAKNMDYTGGLGFLIGITSMFANLTDDKFLSKGLSLALIIIVYSVIIKFILIVPMINALEKHLAGMKKN